jgi:hypothetical protein
MLLKIKAPSLDANCSAKCQRKQGIKDLNHPIGILSLKKKKKKA